MDNNRQNWDRYGQGSNQGSWNQSGRSGGQWQDQPDYGNDSFENQNQPQHPSYGEVYHGNLQQREEETNRARGRSYNQGGGMQSGNRRQDRGYNPGGYGQGDREYSQGGYGQVGNTGGGHGDWESHGSGNQDMGRGYQPGRMAGWGNAMNMGNSGRQGGNFGQDYRSSGMHNQYGNENRRYGGDNRRNDDDQSWWDRARNEVSSWFNNDDDDDNRRNYRSGGGQRMSGQRSTGEHRGKGPRGFQRSDDRIREDICYRLYEDGHVDASDVEVKVEGSEVILTGTVHSREEKRRAEDLVESIMGVRHVENRLRVENDRGSWQSAGSNRMGDTSRSGDTARNSDTLRTGDTTSRLGDANRTGSDSDRTTTYGSSLENRSYTGNTGEGTGIGNESGTTNEIIRNSGSTDKDR